MKNGSNIYFGDYKAKKSVSPIGVKRSATSLLQGRSSGKTPVIQIKEITLWSPFWTVSDYNMFENHPFRDCILEKNNTECRYKRPMLLFNLENLLSFYKSGLCYLQMIAEGQRPHGYWIAFFIKTTSNMTERRQNKWGRVEMPWSKTVQHLTWDQISFENAAPDLRLMDSHLHLQVWAKIRFRGI